MRKSTNKNNAFNTPITTQISHEEPADKTVYRKMAVHIACIIIIGILAYSNTLNSPFVFDDYEYIVNNSVIKELTVSPDPAKIISLPYDLKKQFWNRILGHLSFALNYKIHGLDVKGYHLFNLTIHLVNALLIYVLIQLTFKTPFILSRTKFDPSFDPGMSKSISFICALLFTIHPIQTEAVSYISQRLTSLATLFYFVALIFYVKSRYSKTAYVSVNYFIALVATIFAMKTKEISFTLPICISVYEFMFFTGAWKKRLAYLLPFILTMFIIPLTLLPTDTLGSLFNGIGQASKETVSISRLDYLYTQFSVIATYLRLLVLPVNQNLDYDYPVYHSLAVPTVYLSFLLLLLIIAIAFFLLHLSRKNRSLSWCYRLISFGIFYSFITISVESSIIPIKDVIFEHRMYLPFFGFSLSVATGLIAFRRNLNGPIFSGIAILATLVVVVILTGTTYLRNMIWSSPIALWQDTVEKSPSKSQAHNNLGLSYAKVGRIDDAIKEYRIAITLKPDHPEAHNNLGVNYSKIGRIDDAIKEFLLVIALNPDNPEAHNNLGVNYSKIGRIDDAIKEFLLAIRLRPYYTEVHNNLAISYENKGEFSNAITEYSIISKLDPETAEIHNKLGALYRRMARYDDARVEYLKAIKLKPDFVAAHNNLGFIYEQQGHLDDAIKEYLIAVKIKPDLDEAHFGLGLCYLRKNQRDNALAEFTTALKISPQFVEARKYVEYLSKSERR